MEIINFQRHKRPATYLGDGVYAIFDGYGIWLHTGSHKETEALDRVYLEPEILQRLVQFEKDSKSKEVIERCLLQKEL